MGIPSSGGSGALTCTFERNISTKLASVLALRVGLPTGLLLLAWLVWRSLHWPLVHDAPILHYAAWRIGQGAVPYRDVFDMNFPGVYLVHLAVQRTLGAGDAAWRLFDLAWLAAAAAAVAAFAWPWGRLAAGAGALLLALHHLAGGAWQAGQRDFLLCPLLLAGALGVARWVESGRRAGLLGGGLALGAAMTLKPHAALLAAGLGALLVVGAWRGGRPAAAPLALFAAGVALVPLAVAGWLAAVGALPAWRAIVVEYLLPLYSRLGRPETWSLHRPWAWLPLGAGAVLSAAAAAAGRRLGARHAAAGLGVLYGALHFVAQGKGWEYHLYPLAAFTVVLLVAELEPALARLSRPGALALVVAVVAAAWMLADKAVAAGPAGWERAKAAAVARLADELAARLRPGDTVQVLDTTGGGIHALLRLGVRQPTRFLYDFHFFHDPGHPAIAALRGELLHDLDARPPALVVVFERGWPAGGYERLDAFPALRERLARYDLVHAGPGYRIHAQPDRP